MHSSVLFSNVPRESGGLQGGAGQLSLFGFTYNYAPGSFPDTLVESFAGPHDWLNSSYYYDVRGNSNQSLTGAWEGWNSLNVLLATPMGISTLCTQAPGLCSSAQNAFSNANITLPNINHPIAIQPQIQGQP